MAATITCSCGYRGPSVLDGGTSVCPICRTAVGGGAGKWFSQVRGQEKPPADEDFEFEAADGAPAPTPGVRAATAEDGLWDDEASVFQIPCPNNHLITVKQEMLGKQVVCPRCNEFFVLQAADSVEFRSKQNRRQVYEDEKLARAWIQRAIIATVLVILSFIVMIILSHTWQDLFAKKKPAAKPAVESGE